MPVNYKIYVSVRHHVNQIQALQVQPTANQNGEAGTSLNTAGWRKFAIGTLLVYLAFLVCYLPNFCFLIVYLISGPSSSITVVLDLFSSTLLFLNSTLNPLIYCWKMRRIRLTILTNIKDHISALTSDYRRQKIKPEIIKFHHAFSLSLFRFVLVNGVYKERS